VAGFDSTAETEINTTVELAPAHTQKDINGTVSRTNSTAPLQLRTDWLGIL
jgi:hypothetical protein